MFKKSISIVCLIVTLGLLCLTGCGQQNNQVNNATPDEGLEYQTHEATRKTNFVDEGLHSNIDFTFDSVNATFNDVKLDFRNITVQDFIDKTGCALDEIEIAAQEANGESNQNLTKTIPIAIDKKSAGVIELLNMTVYEYALNETAVSITTNKNNSKNDSLKINGIYSGMKIDTTPEEFLKSLNICDLDNPDFINQDKDGNTKQRIWGSTTPSMSSENHPFVGLLTKKDGTWNLRIVSPRDTRNLSISCKPNDKGEIIVTDLTFTLDCTKKDSELEK